MNEYEWEVLLYHVSNDSTSYMPSVDVQMGESCSKSCVAVKTRALTVTLCSCSQTAGN